MLLIFILLITIYALFNIAIISFHNKLSNILQCADHFFRSDILFQGAPP